MRPQPPAGAASGGPHDLFWLLMGAALLLGMLLARPASAAEAACKPTVLSVMMAPDPQPEKSLDGAQASAKPYPPAAGWSAVELPHVWPYEGDGGLRTGWYRIDWSSQCVSASGDPQLVAVGLANVSAAGALYSNGDLLWSDVSLVEPLSASWNMPRWWLLPRTTLHSGVNTLWLRVTGYSQAGIGAGPLYLGPPDEVRAKIETHSWRQRTTYLITAALSAAVGCIFLVVFLIHRREQAYGWYALMSLIWVAYLGTLLATDSWPFASALSMTRASVMLFVTYVACFCQFTWTFGAQDFPRLRRVLWTVMPLAAIAVLAAPARHARLAIDLAWFGSVAIFLLNCLQFQFHAWRTRELRHVLLAACWLAFIVVGLHDLALVLGGWHGDESWSYISGPIATVFMAVLLGSQLGSQMRRIALFNQELTSRVNDARLELAHALEREHQQRLQHAKVQERLEIAHDLHDGLGASLVRSMAIVEQAAQPLPADRVMSLFKVLRDDLRQVIDHGSSAGAAVPETPVAWMAPLRHRFSNILDDLGIGSQWSIPRRWVSRPTAVQCLALTRVTEEALSNIIKHSRARQVRVTCGVTEGGMLALSIEDDGAGFDVDAVRRAGLSVGLRSMEARAQRMGARLTVTSRPGATAIRIELPLRPAHEESESESARAGAA
ncbi:ATP-binding protein [Diaphorobacter ruginosibacter]|uniref:sensor histidine kinase n=1 Tax=Diaphorobacter ruginosibacter TaxID=1715720 RepID=UPI0033426BA3